MAIRKSMVFLITAAFMLSGGTAFALTAAHQKGATGFDGDCQACHIPHKAAGSKRGFIIEPSATTQATYGYIGAFCLQRCHNGAVTRADLSRSVMFGTFAGGANGAALGSHGLNLQNGGNNAPSSTIVAAALPYGDGTRTKAFECTTCHDVHKNATGDTSEALLQQDIDVICYTCHTNRGTSGAAAWSGYGTGNATGSHPIGTNVNGDVGGGGTPINFTSSFEVAYGASGSHNLGGHAINGGTVTANGMTCVTCHAVHGSQADPGGTGAPGVDAVYSEDLLAVAVTGTTGTADPQLHATGATEVNNTLCEGCHGATTSRWNPGNTAFSHPVDDMAYSGSTPVVKDMGVIPTTLTGQWPFGANTTAAIAGPGIGMGAAAAGQGPRVICESCHTPHPNANVNSGIGGYTAAGYDNIVATGTPILRAPTATVGSICNVCHSVTPTNHHPVGRAFGTLYADAQIDSNGNGIMDCSDCHTGTNAGAHNWAESGFPGLNPNWRPAGNGRVAEAAITGTSINAVANTSQECYICHTNNGARFSPSRVTPGNGNANYQDHGDGSHFLGAVAAGFDWTRGNIDNTAFNASQSSSNWNAKAGSHSRFAGTAANPELVCESCHELEPDKNALQTANPSYTGLNNLLLYNFSDGEVYAGVGSVYRSYLCEGCHGHTPGGTSAASTHPMTGSTVSKAVDAGRGTTTLITTAGTYANASGAPGTGTYPVANAMNCDSCHQVHDANTNSGTFILDTAAANVTAATPRAGSVALYGATISRSTTASGAIDYAAFCTMCHTY